MSELQVERLEHADRLPRGWDSLLGPRDLYVSTSWSALVERSYPTRYRYFGCFLGPRLVGACVAYQAHRRLPPSPFYRPDKLLERLVREGPEGTGEGEAGTHGPAGQEDFTGILPALVCGGRRTSHCGVAVSSDLPMSSRREVLESLVNTLESEAETSRNAALLFPFVDCDADTLLQVLDDRGYRRTISGTCSVLPILDGGWEAYLASLTRNRRRQVVTDRRAVDRSGFQLRQVPATTDLAPRLAPLEVQMHQRHGSYKTLQDSTTAMTNLFELLPGRCFIVIAENACGELAGFAVLVEWKGCLHSRHVGLDYQVKGKVPVYFSLLFYEPYLLGAALGARSIDYSLGTTATKGKRGCRAIEQYLVAKPLTPTAAQQLEPYLPSRRHADGPGERP